MIKQRTYIAEDCPVRDVSRSSSCGIRLVLDRKPFHEQGIICPQVKDQVSGRQSRPITILVEHRDEVFARLATDMAEAGMRVIRARTAFEARKLSIIHAPRLFVANIDLVDQNGWLLAAKLRLLDSDVRMWLYAPRISALDEGRATLLRVDRVFEYGGDLLVLSESILRMIADHPKPRMTEVPDQGDAAEAPAA